MKRYVTYDIMEGNSYNRLYDFFSKIGAKKVTESTYETNTNIDFETFCAYLSQVTSFGDRVFVIYRTSGGDMMHKKIRG